MAADNTRKIVGLVAYVRVSTAMQGLSGLGIEAQRASIQRYADSMGLPVVSWFEEVESGKRSDRPKLAEAITYCRVRGNVGLVAAKLDRFGRRTRDLLALRDSPFPVIPADNPSMGSMVFGILAVVAEEEAAMISARTKAALAAAKARGVKLGGNRGKLHLTQEKGSQAGVAALKGKADARAVDLLPIIEGIKATGAASLRQIAAALNSQGIPTAKGGAWSAVQVQRVMGRIEA